MTLALSLKMKDFFFDRQLVIEKTNAATHKNLAKAGAYVRRVAQRTILRRRKKAKPAPAPPSVHSTDAFRSLRNIGFAHDGDQGVIVGPFKFGRGATSVPELLTKGGKGTVVERLVDGIWTPLSRIKSAHFRPGQPTRKRTGIWGPRPFMAPALELAASKGKLAGLWANSVRR
jgi:hypothetical protein